MTHQCLTCGRELPRRDVAECDRCTTARADELRLAIETTKKHVGGDSGPGDRHVAQLERRLEEMVNG